MILGERKKELEHVRSALGYNGYSEWMLAKTIKEVEEKAEEEEEKGVMATSGNREERKTWPVVILSRYQVFVWII